MLETQYNQTVSTKRFMQVPGTNRKELSTILSSVPCHIQPLESQFSADIEGGFGKDFLMFCAQDDIQEGDRVYLDDKEYRVTAIDKLSFMNNNHMEVQIRIFES